MIQINFTLDIEKKMGHGLGRGEATGVQAQLDCYVFVLSDVELVPFFAIVRIFRFLKSWKDESEVILSSPSSVPRPQQKRALYFTVK